MRRLPPSGSKARDRGAAAVEFALCLPLLLFLVFGIIDFGRLLNAQITLTNAANAGARLVSLGEPNVVTGTQQAAPGLNGVGVNVQDSCPAGAGPSQDAIVSVSYSFSFVTPVGALAGLIGGGGFGAPIDLTAQGVAPCED